MWFGGGRVVGVHAQCVGEALLILRTTKGGGGGAGRILYAGQDL